MNRSEILLAALREPVEAVRRRLFEELRALHPGKLIVVAQGSSIRYFCQKGHARLEYVADCSPELNATPYEGKIHYGSLAGWANITWQSQSYELVWFTIGQSYHQEKIAFLVADSQAAADALFLAVDAFENDLNRRVLVFHNGCWKHDEEIWEDIQNSSYENLILAGELADTIRGDIQNWINAKELYAEHNIPWKRGLILVGPPGNGKTHFIKATINHFGLNTLYVRNFSEGHEEDEDAIQSIFARARKCAPCLLILEDLDSLVTSGNRSYFLNELDGFARNEGICMIASANDPGKLDPALVNRPSRFDRRYVFDLPGPVERAAYVRMMVGRLTPQPVEVDYEALAAETEDFSFAYLKELVLSSLMAWLSGGQSQSFSAVLSSTAAILREQIDAGTSADEQQRPSARPPWMRRRQRQRTPPVA